MTQGSEGYTNDLQQPIAHLARCRLIEEQEKANLEDIEAEIQERYGAMLDHARRHLATARADVADAEGWVRSMALDAYRDNGKTDKRPHPAVQIKTYTVLTYVEDVALEYCRQHLPKALKLNAREFERAAKVLEPDFVTIGEEDRATIARDLSQFVEALQV